MTVLGTLTLPGVERSVVYARQFVRDLLGSDHPAMYEANVAMCELFTNSLQHSRSGDGGQITIVVATGAGFMQISVLGGLGRGQAGRRR
jgi:anti-sigma regulatory factor (Ser/Thr protein kinase)